MFNMHSFCITHGRHGDILTCFCHHPASQKKCVCVTFLVVMAKGLLENAKHISPQTDLWLAKWVHMRPVKHQFQAAGGRCTAGASRAKTQQLLWSTVWGNEGRKVGKEVAWVHRFRTFSWGFCCCCCCGCWHFFIARFNWGACEPFVTVKWPQWMKRFNQGS